MKKTIIARHGSSIFPLALHLGVDYLSITSHHESMVGQMPPEPFASFFKVGPFSLESCADGAYQEIVRACKAAYFGPLSREAALTIANGITEAGVLHLADDLEYNNVTFVDAWNYAHPDQDPIQYDAGFSI